MSSEKRRKILLAGRGGGRGREEWYAEQYAKKKKKSEGIQTLAYIHLLHHTDSLWFCGWHEGQSSRELHSGSHNCSKTLQSQGLQWAQKARAKEILALNQSRCAARGEEKGAISKICLQEVLSNQAVYLISHSKEFLYSRGQLKYKWFWRLHSFYSILICLESSEHTSSSYPKNISRMPTLQWPIPSEPDLVTLHI